jgi:uncharacterized protein YcnI
VQIRRLVVTAAAALVVTVLGAVPAWAHASFDVSVVPASDTVDVVLRVPIERDSSNAFIDVRVPPGWSVEACGGSTGWSCATNDRDDGTTVINLAAAETGAGDVDRFALSLGTPAEEGSYDFPVVQTYADGTEVAWIGDPGEDRPSPRIQVGDDSTPVVGSTEPPDHDTIVDSDSDSDVTGADQTDATDTDTDADAQTDPDDGGSGGAAATDDEPADDSSPPEDFTPADGVRALPPEDDGRGSALPWILGAVGVIVLAGGTAVIARR